MSTVLCKKEVNVVLPDWGIGDAICALYGLHAYRHANPDATVTLHLRNQFQWAALAEIPNLRTKRFRENRKIANPIFLRSEGDDKLKKSPKELYASFLGVTPDTPLLRAEIRSAAPLISGRYVVVSPFASRNNRSWSISNWERLISQIRSIGYKVIVLDALGQQKRCESFDAEIYCGKGAAWTANACLNAELVITNDSGIAHLSGWLGVKTLVIMSQLNPYKLFDYTDNIFILPEGDCVGCQFDRTLGYEEKCDYSCEILQSIKVDRIMDEFYKALNVKIQEKDI